MGWNTTQPVESPRYRGSNRRRAPPSGWSTAAFGSGNRLHQATAWAGVVIVVVVVFTLPGDKGVDPKGKDANHGGHKAEASMQAGTEIDQLSHGGLLHNYPLL